MIIATYVFLGLTLVAQLGALYFSRKAKRAWLEAEQSWRERAAWIERAGEGDGG